MIILNEKEYAENCLSGQQEIDNPYYVLTILAKYYYFYKGFRNKKIISLLTDYFEDNYMPYKDHVQEWDTAIEKISANAGKYPLTMIDEIWITESELDTISRIDQPELERIAFVYLCLSKIEIQKNPNNTGWVSMDDKELFKLARVSCKAIMRDRMIGMLITKGILEPALRNDNLSCRVTFIDESSEKVLRITDFRELGYEYLKYKGESFIRCGECGILVKGNTNGTKKYCKECSADSSRYYEAQKTKVIVCEDCGEEVVVSAKNTKTTRCEVCRKIHSANETKKRVQKFREEKSNTIM